MFTRPQFAAWLQARRDAGETMAVIGKSLGVSRVTVTLWLSGKRNPSSTALMLAGELCRGPMEMASGLPSPQESSSGACTHLRASRTAADYSANARRV